MHPKRIASKKLFLTGTDESHVYGGRHLLMLPGGETSFVIGELPAFGEAERKLPEELFEGLLEQLEGAEKGLITYRSAEGLKLHYLETPEYIVVVSAGEYQPGMHRVYIEGIFER